MVTAKIVQPLNPDSLPQMKGIDGLKGDSPLGVNLPADSSGVTSNTKQSKQPEIEGTEIPLKIEAVQPESKPLSEARVLKSLVWKLWLPGSPALTAQRMQ